MIFCVRRLKNFRFGSKTIESRFVFIELFSVLREDIEVGVEELDNPSFFPSFLPFHVYITKLSFVETEKSFCFGEYIDVSVRTRIRWNSFFPVRIAVFLHFSTLYIGADETWSSDKIEFF
ncbi:MAG: hypothetical protein ACD_78C00125G0001, partial [uncultured bacterium (gcode 4)]